jgi:hypothetical protein
MGVIVSVGVEVDVTEGVGAKAEGGIGVDIGAAGGR